MTTKMKIKWTYCLAAMALALVSGIAFSEGAPFLVIFLSAYISGRVSSSQYLTVTETADK